MLRHGRSSSLIAVSAASLLLAALAATPLLAQTAVDTSEIAESARQPGEVNIEADRMEVLDQEKRAIFIGNVDAQRGNIAFKTDRLVANYEETAGESGGTDVTFLEATGAVVIETPEQRITGAWAKMDVKANQVTVGGDVVVTQGNTVLRGEQLFVDLNKDTSEMTGGRVRGRFVPGQ
jgi:lipopolysaccharide export system protein LptA